MSERSGDSDSPRGAVRAAESRLSASLPEGESEANEPPSRAKALSQLIPRTGAMAPALLPLLLLTTTALSLKTSSQVSSEART